MRNKRILATGYNGAPSGLPYCLEIGCLGADGHSLGPASEICRGIHAEQNAIIQAALHGVSTEDSTLYCTDQPCSQCTKMLINAGVKEIIYENDYPDELALQLITEAGIPVRNGLRSASLTVPPHNG